MRLATAFVLGMGLAAMISAQTWGWAVNSWKVEAEKRQKLYEINRDCYEAEKKRADGWHEAHQRLQKRYDDLVDSLEKVSCP